MSVGTIYASPTSHLSTRVLAVAALAGVQVDKAADYVHGTTNKTPEYLAKFPAGKAPAFESKTGFTLFESSAIERYLARLAPNSIVIGSTPEEIASVDQWISYVDSELHAVAQTSFALLSGALSYVKPVDTFAREKLYKNLDVLEKFLQTRTFLVGHRITVADINLAAFIGRLFTTLAGPEERAKFPNVQRHHETIVNHKLLKPVFGDIKYADKAQQFVPPAKEKKPAAAPAAPKPKAAPAPAADDDDDEPDVKEEPKPKNPLDSLPKSTLNLEDWKRAYSNLDTRGPKGSLEWFYEKYDAEGYSIWKVAFKYPEELTQVFMSSNQIGGFFNRLEASRKYLFGSMGVLGANNDSLIEGVLIARGQDIKPVVEVAPDWESYEFTKLDLANAEQKSFFEGALAWDLEVNGKKWADGKNFK